MSICEAWSDPLDESPIRRPMKKLYIAGHSQEEARAVAKLCKEAGYEITSRWLEEDFGKSPNYTDADKTCIADNDVDDVKAADALVLLASPRRVPGGKFVEVGVAMGLNKPIFVLGHRENMLMYHHHVQRFDSAEDFLRLVCLKCLQTDPRCSCYP